MGEALREDDFRAIEVAKLEAVKISLEEPEETVDRLRGINPGMLLVVRLTTDLSKEAISTSQFLTAIEPNMGRLYTQGIRYFEVHANPNLQIEGWQRSWPDGAGFSGWFLDVLASLRRIYPDARFGFPGLAPGEPISGWREDPDHFLNRAEPAVAAADWVGVNCSWTNTAQIESVSGGRRFESYRLRFPDKLLFITEFNNPASLVSPQTKAHQYLEFYRLLRRRDGIGAAFSYALSASVGHDAVVWRRKAEGIGLIPEFVGGRGF